MFNDALGLKLQVCGVWPFVPTQSRILASLLSFASDFKLSYFARRPLLRFLLQPLVVIGLRNRALLHHGFLVLSHESWRHEDRLNRIVNLLLLLILSLQIHLYFLPQCQFLQQWLQSLFNVLFDRISHWLELVLQCLDTLLVALDDKF
jgi:hypothetical protein